jgi:hypothetical protein
MPPVLGKEKKYKKPVSQSYSVFLYFHESGSLPPTNYINDSLFRLNESNWKQLVKSFSE